MTSAAPGLPCCWCTPPPPTVACGMRRCPRSPGPAIACARRRLGTRPARVCGSFRIGRTPCSKPATSTPRPSSTSTCGWARRPATPRVPRCGPCSGGPSSCSGRRPSPTKPSTSGGSKTSPRRLCWCRALTTCPTSPPSPTAWRQSSPAYPSGMGRPPAERGAPRPAQPDPARLHRGDLPSGLTLRTVARSPPALPGRGRRVGCPRR